MVAEALRAGQGAAGRRRRGRNLGRRRSPRPHRSLTARIYGLIDGNSFYCSVEAAFDPKLKGKPVIVLSNNDGCAIARSKGAKALGIKMGDPWHLVRDRPELRDVHWMSSNFALYGDISRRVFQVLAERVPRAEPYSIDETFLDLAGLPGDLHERCRQLRADVLRITKVPTCIGGGPTKTIAKLGNAIAKDTPELEGLCDLTEPSVRAGYYAGLPAAEVWGIGGRTVEKLQRAGIITIADFVAMPPKQVRELLTVVGARIQSELRGVSCLSLTLAAATRKGIAVTRSFGHAITNWGRCARPSLPMRRAPARSYGRRACRPATWQSSCRPTRTSPTNLGTRASEPHGSSRPPTPRR